MKSSRVLTLAASALFALAILAVVATVWPGLREPQSAGAQSAYNAQAQGKQQDGDNEPQAQPTAIAQAPKTSTITVRGSGSISVQPDTVKISIGVTIFDKTVKAAQDQASSITNDMADKLKAAGINSTDYRTGQYSVEPVMDYSGGKGGAPDQAPTLTGFRVSNILEVTLRDPSKAPGLIDELVSAGANTVYEVNYSFANTDDLTRKAYDAAVKDAQSRASRLAGLSNMTLGRIVSVTDASANVPGPVYDAGMGGKGGAGPIFPGSQTVQSDLVVTFEATAK